jgi:hypothetical protein
MYCFYINLIKVIYLQIIYFNIKYIKVTRQFYKYEDSFFGERYASKKCKCVV